ncbi:homeodomain-interacting protein kinase 1-like [Festucalex cinctus]
MSLNKSDRFLIYKGSTLGQSYKVEDFLGEGSFGLVVKCRCTETGKMSAIKVIKNHPTIMHQARKEIAILKQLGRLNPDRCHIVRWNDFFFDKYLICLNFELLDQTLNHFQQERNLPTLSICQISPILYQMTTALLHLSEIRIVHTDIKTDNVMVVDRRQQPLNFKLIDFGLAKNVLDVKPGDYVQTSWYRAPEVILGLPLTEAIDMWSLGIMAVKLAAGFHLYPGESDYETLSYMIETQGQPSKSILDRGLRTCAFFKREKTGARGWKFKTPEEMGYKSGEVRLLNRKSLEDILEDIEVVQKTGEKSNQGFFIKLVTKMLQLDPDLRSKPVELLQHSFFNRSHTGIDGEATALSSDQTFAEETQSQDETQIPIKVKSKDGWLKRLFRKIQGAFTVN